MAVPPLRSPTVGPTDRLRARAAGALGGCRSAVAAQHPSGATAVEIDAADPSLGPYLPHRISHLPIASTPAREGPQLLDICGCKKSWRSPAALPPGEGSGLLRGRQAQADHRDPENGQQASNSRNDHRSGLAVAAGEIAPMTTNAGSISPCRTRAETIGR